MRRHLLSVLISLLMFAAFGGAPTLVAGEPVSLRPLMREFIGVNGHFWLED